MTATNITVIDERKPVTKSDEIKIRYPVGALVLNTELKIRAIVVDHTDKNVVVLNGAERVEMTPGATLLVLAPSTEDYVTRLDAEATRLVNDYNYNRDAVRNTVQSLKTEERVSSDLVRMVVTTVGHYVLRPRNRYESLAAMMADLRTSYYLHHGEFNSGYFTQCVDEDDPAMSTTTTVSTTFELVDSFPVGETKPETVGS